MRTTLELLPLRERRVLELRYGVLGEVPHSVAQTSKALQLTPHRIRALEEEALRRLRHLPEAQGLREAA
jgi:RNA polymerase primary sigma factor